MGQQAFLWVLASIGALVIVGFIVVGEVQYYRQRRPRLDSLKPGAWEREK